MYTWMMINLQDSNSYISMLMVYFHDFLLLILMMILILVLYIMVWIMFNKLINLKILHNQFIEIVWTLLPMLILIYMALPSLKILYLFEEMIKPYLTVKIIGHQWYWSYEYSDFTEVSFDSFMLNDYNSMSNFRLLDVDNRLILPKNLNIRGLVTSMDVIHSWTIPSLGIKIDTVPGRMNQILMNIEYFGLMYGQCSEICGMNHSFMPIVLESINLKLFMKWLKNFI